MLSDDLLRFSFIGPVVFVVIVVLLLLLWWRSPTDPKKQREQILQLLVVAILTVGLLYSCWTNWRDDLAEEEGPLVQYEVGVLPLVDDPEFGIFSETSFQVILDDEQLPVIFIPVADDGAIVDARALDMAASKQIRHAIERGTLHVTVRVENRDQTAADTTRILVTFPGPLVSDPGVESDISPCLLEEGAKGSERVLITCEPLYRAGPVEVTTQLRMQDVPSFWDALTTWLDNLPVDGFELYEHLSVKEYFLELFEEGSPGTDLVSFDPCIAAPVVELSPDFALDALRDSIRVQVVFGKSGEGQDISGSPLARLPKPTGGVIGANIHGPADSCF